MRVLGPYCSDEYIGFCRLFSRGETSRQAAQSLAVGDLLRRPEDLDFELSGLFPNHGGGQQGRERSAPAVSGQSRPCLTVAEIGEYKIGGGLFVRVIPRYESSRDPIYGFRSRDEAEAWIECDRLLTKEQTMNYVLFPFLGERHVSYCC